MFRQGSYGKALPMAREALALSERVLGHNHLGVATSLHDLAALLTGTARYAQARSYYECVLAIRTEVLGPERKGN